MKQEIVDILRYFFKNKTIQDFQSHEFLDSLAENLIANGVTINYEEIGIEPVIVRAQTNIPKEAFGTALKQQIDIIALRDLADGMISEMMKAPLFYFNLDEGWNEDRSIFRVSSSLRVIPNHRVYKRRRDVINNG